jgi:broad specificity phosphatase PhoE
VRGACEELLDEIRQRDVVVVSHVSPIKAAIAWTLGVGDEVAWRLFVQVASVARVAVGPAGPSLHSFNDGVAVD